MRADRIRKTQENEKGQSLVEFALVVPLLLLLVVGIFEFGRAWMTKNIMTGAAREAARVAVVSGVNWKAYGEARGNDVLANLPSSTCIITDGTDAHGNPLKIATVTYVYNFLTIVNLLPGFPNSITLTSTTTMRTE